jgi:single-stranded DNA-binding protein
MERIFFNRITIAGNISQLKRSQDGEFLEIMLETYESWPDGHEKTERHEVRCYDAEKQGRVLASFKVGDAVQIQGRLRRKDEGEAYMPFVHALTVSPAPAHLMR